jgi:hypothetical protein
MIVIRDRCHRNTKLILRFPNLRIHLRNHVQVHAGRVPLVRGDDALLFLSPLEAATVLVGARMSCGFGRLRPVGEGRYEVLTAISSNVKRLSLLPLLPERSCRRVSGIRSNLGVVGP